MLIATTHLSQGLKSIFRFGLQFLRMWRREMKRTAKPATSSASASEGISLTPPVSLVSVIEKIQFVEVMVDEAFEWWVRFVLCVRFVNCLSSKFSRFDVVRSQRINLANAKAALVREGLYVARV